MKALRGFFPEPEQETDDFVKICGTLGEASIAALPFADEACVDMESTGQRDRGKIQGVHEEAEGGKTSASHKTTSREKETVTGFVRKKSMTNEKYVLPECTIFLIMDNCKCKLNSCFNQEHLSIA